MTEHAAQEPAIEVWTPGRGDARAEFLVVGIVRILGIARDVTVEREAENRIVDLAGERGIFAGISDIARYRLVYRLLSTKVICLPWASTGGISNVQPNP